MNPDMRRVHRRFYSFSKKKVYDEDTNLTVAPQTHVWSVEVFEHIFTQVWSFSFDMHQKALFENWKRREYGIQSGNGHKCVEKEAADVTLAHTERSTDVNLARFKNKTGAKKGTG